MTTPHDRPRPTVAALAAAFLVAVASTACAAAEGPATGASPSARTATPSEPAPPRADVTPEAPAPEAEPTPEPTPDLRPTEAPARSVAAGTVAEGAPAAAEGRGSAEVTFERDGEFAVVVHLDCSACSGATVLTGPDRGTPFGAADGALAGDYLMDVFKGGDPEQAVWLAAEGPWSLRFESWNDLAPVTGEQSGDGSKVLAFGDTATRLDVEFAPAGPDDSFAGRYFSVSGSPRVFGDSVAFTDSYDVSLPGVLAITTNGSWTVTPGS
ncbi:hypothetical protein [Promicromonospora iranensis]|uniref:Lipoprotein n=1 Tax=Promicromonospora iranensis TaxID=1105144 RepID=A0ABU2CVG8_9MICO|nr:hypothetical protein [Promicromonospora iranensis]MDR7385331.1 hypothetical protein [Promicromonospora iranensis]